MSCASALTPPLASAVEVGDLEGLVVDEHQVTLLRGEQCVESCLCGARHDDSFCRGRSVTPAGTCSRRDELASTEWAGALPMAWHDAMAGVRPASKTCSDAGR
jgi:hypothetical protein